MGSHYDVFEFTAFMDQYLKVHPEVVRDQQRGWNIYWNPKKAGRKGLHGPHRGSQMKR